MRVCRGARRDIPRPVPQDYSEGLSTTARPPMLPHVPFSRPLFRSVVRSVVRPAAGVAAIVFPLCAAALDYAGVGASTDPGGLREQFPASRHEFWQRGTGAIVRPEDADGRFETMLKEGDGLYIVKLSPDDTRGDMTAVSVSLDHGKVRRWILSFERPGAGTKPEQVEARYPGCKRVLDTISERYGPPRDFSTRIEEGMQHRLRTWTDPDATLRLDCGKLLKRNPIFAIDIEITPTPK